VAKETHFLLSCNTLAIISYCKRDEVAGFSEVYYFFFRKCALSF